MNFSFAHFGVAKMCNHITRALTLLYALLNHKTRMHSSRFQSTPPKPLCQITGQVEKERDKMHFGAKKVAGIFRL